MNNFGTILAFRLAGGTLQELLPAASRWRPNLTGSCFTTETRPFRRSRTIRPQGTAKLRDIPALVSFELIFNYIEPYSPVSARQPSLDPAIHVLGATWGDFQVRRGAAGYSTASFAPVMQRTRCEERSKRKTLQMHRVYKWRNTFLDQPRTSTSPTTKHCRRQLQCLCPPVSRSGLPSRYLLLTSRQSP